MGCWITICLGLQNNLQTRVQANTIKHVVTHIHQLIWTSFDSFPTSSSCFKNSHEENHEPVKRDPHIFDSIFLPPFRKSNWNYEKSSIWNNRRHPSLSNHRLHQMELWNPCARLNDFKRFKLIGWEREWDLPSWFDALVLWRKKVWISFLLSALWFPPYFFEFSHFF